MLDTDATTQDADDASRDDEDLESTDREQGDEGELDTGDGEDGDDAGDDDEDQDEDLEEVELDGRKYTVPKEVKRAVLREADYTKKTQEVAAMRRELDTREQAFAQRTEAQQANFKDHTKLAAMADRIETLRGIDVSRLEPEDANETRWALVELEREHDRLSADLKGREEKQALEAQTNRQRAFQDGVKILERDIPGWGADYARTLGQFAQSDLGFSPEELDDVTDVRFMKLLHLAHAGKKATAQRAGADRLAKAGKVRPAATVSGGSPAPKGDRIPAKDWIERRNAELAKKAGR